MSTLYTPMIEHVFDTFFAYGLVEAAWKGGIEKGELIPLPPGYEIITKSSSDEIEEAILNGVKRCLKEWKLTLEILKKRNKGKKGSLLRRDWPLYVFFDQFKNKEPNIYKRMKSLIEAFQKAVEEGKILECLGDPEKPHKESKDRVNLITVYITLAPTLGKYTVRGLYKYTDVSSSSYSSYQIRLPPKMMIFAAIGAYYYPTLLIGNNKTNMILIKPLDSLSFLEVVSLKDLQLPPLDAKTSSKIIGSGTKPIILYMLAHSESLASLETIRNKDFQQVSYVISKEKGKRAIRNYEEYKITKIADFLWNLKRKDLIRTIKIIDKIVYSSDSDLSSLFIDSILYDRWENMYKVLRKLASSQKYFVDVGLADAINKWFLKRRGR